MSRHRRHRSRLWIGMLLFMCMMPSSLFGLTLTVQTRSGDPVGGYRWLIEEDTTNHAVPGALVADSLAVDIHNSYAPVVSKGHSDASVAEIDVPSDKRYVVSVLPDEGHAMSGQLVAVGQTAVTVIVNPFPIPTSQITVFAFHDNYPLNNAPDAAETGLEGFTVIIAEAGGRQMMDAFGNMLGTTYETGENGEFLRDEDGMPIVDMMGSGIIKTDANGEATIKYIAPGKYGVQVIPPAGQGWVQTSTIEGTKVVDAWVKSNEPPMFVEIGPAGWHVFIGFVKQFDVITQPTAPGDGTITGRVVTITSTVPPIYRASGPASPSAGPGSG